MNYFKKIRKITLRFFISLVALLLVAVASDVYLGTNICSAISISGIDRIAYHTLWFQFYFLAFSFGLTITHNILKRYPFILPSLLRLLPTRTSFFNVAEMTFKYGIIILSGAVSFIAVLLTVIRIEKEDEEESTHGVFSEHERYDPKNSGYSTMKSLDGFEP